MQVLALSRLVFEFAPELEAFRLAVPDLLSTVMLLTEDPAREVKTATPFTPPLLTTGSRGACLTLRFTPMCDVSPGRGFGRELRACVRGGVPGPGAAAQTSRYGHNRQLILFGRDLGNVPRRPSALAGRV